MKLIKLKRIMSLAIGLPIILLSVSCSDEFIEVSTIGTALEDNYYRNESEAYYGLVAVYDVIGKASKI